MATPDETPNLDPNEQANPTLVVRIVQELQPEGRVTTTVQGLPDHFATLCVLADAQRLMLARIGEERAKEKAGLGGTNGKAQAPRIYVPPGFVPGGN